MFNNKPFTILKKKPVKNIILLLFIIVSFYAPWYTNGTWCFGCDREPALGTFFNTLYFIGAVVIYAVLADKWWNIPCILYMLIVSIASAGGIIAPESDVFNAVNLVFMANYWGLYFLNISNRVYYVITLITGIPVLWLMISKYCRCTCNKAN